MLTHKQAEVVKKALVKITLAEDLLTKSTNLLTREFGNNVPSLSKKGIEIFCEAINDLDFHIQYLKSFTRVSVLQQIVKPRKFLEEKSTK